MPQASPMSWTMMSIIPMIITMNSTNKNKNSLKNKKVNNLNKNTKWTW